MPASLKRAGVDAVVGGALGSSIERAVKGITAESALLVLGAGDVETIRDDLLHQLAVRGARARSAFR